MEGCPRSGRFCPRPRAWRRSTRRTRATSIGGSPRGSGTRTTRSSRMMMRRDEPTAAAREWSSSLRRHQTRWPGPGPEPARGNRESCRLTRWSASKRRPRVTAHRSCRRSLHPGSRGGSSGPSTGVRVLVLRTRRVWRERCSGEAAYAVPALTACRRAPTLRG